MSDVPQVPTKPDPTMPYRACPTHGPSVATAYIGRERYGCWHCHPTRPAESWEVSGAGAPSPEGLAARPEWEVADLPEWMLD